MPNSPAIPSIPITAPATLPAIAIDSAGNIIVAWTQEETYETIYLRRWRQGQWESLGSSSSGKGVNATRGEATAPSIALDSTGNPAIAWQDRSPGNHEIFYRHWDGSGWQELEGSASGGGVSKTNTGYSGFPSLALDSHGSPVVAWEEHYGSRSDIYVRRLASDLFRHGWRDIGDHAGVVGFQAKLSAAIHPSLRLDPQGNPSLAWMDSETGPDQVYFLRWTGSRWEELAGSASNGGVSRSREVAASVDLELDSAANPILSWKEGSGDGAVLRVKRWNGRQWDFMGNVPAEAGSNPTWPRLALDARRQPVLGYRAGSQIFIQRWSGTGWDSVGSIHWTNPPEYTLPAKRQLALAAGAGKACVAWVERGSIGVACFGL